MNRSKQIAFLFFLSLMIGGGVYTFGQGEKNVDGAKAKEMMLGGLLKGALENMHITQMKIDDDVSQKAFKEFIKKLDYGKQFLTQQDVGELEKYKKDLDNELESGKLDIVDAAFSKLNAREDEVKKYVLDRLKKPMDFSKDAMFETDVEKRKFANNMDELKERWDQILRYEILSEYADLKEQQEHPEDSKDKKDKKNSAKVVVKNKKEKEPKKLSDEEMMKKAVAEVVKSYEKIFSRLADRKRDDQLDKFYNSFTAVYDPHTYYLIPEEKDGFDIDMSGKLEGIGALLREDGIYIKVEDVIPGSPSWKTKLMQKDDVILKVGQGNKEPVDVVNMSVQDAVKLIRGKKGTEVRLTLKKPDGLIKVVPIVRDVVELEESYVKTVELMKKGSKDRFGYINLPKFYRDFSDKDGRNCTDDMRAALEKLNQQNVKGLILDLRNNGGGALIDASMMSGLFIKEGPIVQVKAHTGSVEVLEDKDPSIIFDKPMIVLVNNNSASASEILAAALQDYKRAVIVGGEHTHGKGTVQQVIDLDSVIPPIAKSLTPFGALKITIQKFYRVTGGSTQYKGVTPDVILPDVMSVLEKGERFLDYSLPWGQVPSVTYKPWSLFAIDTQKLAEKSNSRTKISDKFKKIFESIDWYKMRKEQTEKSLLVSNFLADRELVRKKSKELEEQKADLDLQVLPIENKKAEDEKERFQRLAEGLQKDPYIDESVNILNDMLVQIKK